MEPHWLHARSPQKGVDMVLNWRGLRASAGAAALAVALAAGVPAQAKLYSLTVTAYDSNGSKTVGSGVVDSTPTWFYNVQGNSFSEHALSDTSGYLSKLYDIAYDGSGSALMISGPQGAANITSGSYEYPNEFGGYNYSSRVMSGYLPYLDLFTTSAISNNTFDDFNVGTYDFVNPTGMQGTAAYDSSWNRMNDSDIQLNPVSMTLRIGAVGPAAPAPLAGGGLLSALAALLALGMTRFVRRGDVLAALAAAIALLVTRGGSLIRGFGKLGTA